MKRREKTHTYICTRAYSEGREKCLEGYVPLNSKHLQRMGLGRGEHSLISLYISTLKKKHTIRMSQFIHLLKNQLQIVGKWQWWQHSYLISLNPHIKTESNRKQNKNLWTIFCKARRQGISMNAKQGRANQQQPQCLHNFSICARKQQDLWQTPLPKLESPKTAKRKGRWVHLRTQD